MLTKVKLNFDEPSDSIIYLQLNSLDSHDSYFDLFDQPTHSIQFNKFTRLETDRIGIKPQNEFFLFRFGLDSNVMEHQRKIYGLLDAIGEFGGVFSVFKSLLGYFLFPISYLSFVLKAMEKLYFVKTKVSKHSQNKFIRIELSLWEEVKIFVLKSFCWC